MADNIIYKDIEELSRKATPSGSEKIPVSEDEYITPQQIAAMGNSDRHVFLSESEYQALAVKDPTKIYCTYED